MKISQISCCDGEYYGDLRNGSVSSDFAGNHTGNAHFPFGKAGC